MAWLLTYAVKLEYDDQIEKFVEISRRNTNILYVKLPSMIKPDNAFESMDLSDREFQKNLKNIAFTFKIPQHPSVKHTVVANKNLIKTFFRLEDLTKGTSSTEFSKYFKVDESKGNITSKAAKVLQILQIQNLRKLQTVINETIVLVQNYTADPRTDTKLGKLGY